MMQKYFVKKGMVSILIMGGLQGCQIEENDTANAYGGTRADIIQPPLNNPIVPSNEPKTVPASGTERIVQENLITPYYAGEVNRTHLLQLWASSGENSTATITSYPLVEKNTALSSTTSLGTQKILPILPDNQGAIPICAHVEIVNNKFISINQIDNNVISSYTPKPMVLLPTSTGYLIIDAMKKMTIESTPDGRLIAQTITHSRSPYEWQVFQSSADNSWRLFAPTANKWMTYNDTTNTLELTETKEIASQIQFKAIDKKACSI